MKPLAIAFLLLAYPSLAADRQDLPQNGQGMVGFANQFYDNCAVVERLHDSTINSEQVELMKTMFCLGYVEGLAFGIAAADSRRNDFTFCLPSIQVTNEQIVRIIRKYIADHPANAHELTAILAVAALREAFPCRK